MCLHSNRCLCTFLLDRECNPSLLSLVSNTSVSTTMPSPTSVPGVVQWWDAQGIVGLVIFLFCTFYARYIMWTNAISLQSCSNFPWFLGVMNFKCLYKDTVRLMQGYILWLFYSSTSNSEKTVLIILSKATDCVLWFFFFCGCYISALKCE